MADNATQNVANHTKYDPPFHYMLLPIFGITPLLAIWNAIRNPGWCSAGLVVLSIGALIAVFKIRVYSLKVQDRVIRLEERLRLQQILTDPLRGRSGELTERQLIGLRFASDGASFADSGSSTITASPRHPVACASTLVEKRKPEAEFAK